MRPEALLECWRDVALIGRGRIFFSVLAIVCCLGPAATPAAAQPRISEGGSLRIASWNLLDAVSVGLIDRRERTKRAWRNTFGSERRISEKPKFAGEKLGADVVLLQGVKSVGEVRQLFPARSWKLIVSRQILRDGNSGRFSATTRVEGSGTTTAIAVRYQRRLRVTGIEHLLDLAPETEEEDASGSEAQHAAAGDQKKSHKEPSPSPKRAPSAGVAVRLAFSGNVFWVVSAALDVECRSSVDQRCEAAGKLEAWLDEKRGKGRSVVIGGQLFPGLLKTGSRGACANQEIIADKALDTETGADTVAGCIAFADIAPL